MLLHLNGFIPGYPQQYVTSTNLYSWVKRNKVEENFCRRKERNFKASTWASSSKIGGVNCSATMPAPNKPNWGVFLQSKPFVNIISFIHATLHYMLRNSMHESLYHNRVFRLNYCLISWDHSNSQSFAVSPCLLNGTYWTTCSGPKFPIFLDENVACSAILHLNVGSYLGSMSLLPLSENMYWTYGQLKAEDLPFTLAFVVSQATPFGARHTGQKHHWSTGPLHCHF